MEHHNETHRTIVQKNLSEKHFAESSSLLEINGTMIFIIFSFVIFTIIMQRVFYLPIAQIRGKRHQHFRNLKDDAERAMKNAEDLNAQYTGKIMSAKKTVSENTAKTMEEANKEKVSILEERNQQVAEFLQSNRQRIRDEKARSLEELKPRVEEYANDIFKKILGEDISITIGETNERTH